jgi:hypothetical protein
MGLSATILEDPFAMQKSLKVPEDHFEVCKAGCLPYKGNAGGNTANLTDLSTANNSPLNPNPGAVYTKGSHCPDPNTSSTTSTPSYTPSGTSNPSYTTSTLYSTTTYTATSCPPEVTSCPGKPYVTTKVIAYSTTVCPVTPDYPKYTTSTLYSTTTYTATSCKPEVTDCPYTPYVTTEVVPYTTTVCPVTNNWTPTLTPTLTTKSYGTDAPTAVSTTKGLLVTAAAGKPASGLGAAAIAGVLAAAALL